MAEPSHRERFWVTDPPAVFEGEDEDLGQNLLIVFTTRGKLLHYYKEGLDIEVDRRKCMVRRWAMLKKDCAQIQMAGVAIDPEVEGLSHIVLFQTKSQIDQGAVAMANGLLKKT